MAIFRSKITKKQIAHKLLAYIFHAGLLRAGRSLWKNSLTVLNYHRINDPNQNRFDSFKMNVSARTEDFDNQMEYISHHFNVVSMSDVVSWLDNRQSLPHHATLITFDDGYLDNFTNAYPILKKYDFPATIFLTTNHIDTGAIFYWDLIAYCFHQTTKTNIILPDGSALSWDTSQQRDRVCAYLVETVKFIRASEKQRWISSLPDQLNVSIPKSLFHNLMLTWDQVREMYKNGIEFGGHTMNHPILSRIPIDEARLEIDGSKKRIEQELNNPILSFAYPNGMENDFTPELESKVSQAGYKVAFTLLNGPSDWQEVRCNRFAIRRVFISHTDSLPKFALKTSRINRFRK